MPDTVDMDKICAGCLMYEQYVKDPNTYNECRGFIAKDKDRPCQYCLIKVMCSIDCDKLKERVWV